MKNNRYDGWHVQPNQQNAHMLESLISLSKTVHQLIKMGITVTGTTQGGTQPSIRVLDSTETRQLKGAVIKTRNIAGQRVIFCRAHLNNCTIEWESKNVH